MAYADLLSEAMWSSCSQDRYWQLSPAAAQCLVECECNTVNRVAMWCAQIGHESSGLYYMEEIADGSAYEGREDLGNIYPGDGCLFKGRGPIMVTGRSNYTECSGWAYDQGLVPSPTFFVDFPEEMAGDVYGFTGTTWYWTTQRPMNDAADAGDIELATYYVNGGYNGLEDRTNRWNHCLAMGERIMGLTDQQVAGAAPQLVGERVLAYDHSIVPQETGYWCGPASTQVVLNAQGIHISEQQLANEMGTDMDGTDDISIIEGVLDGYVPHADYRSLHIANDPPSTQERDELWAGLVNSINTGHGVVMNWVAPPGNYPVGIKGSQSPSYGGGTIFHYVAAMGYDDNPDQRAVWIADSGFNPFGYWCAFDQVATLIPPKGYAWASVPAPVTAPPTGEAPDYKKLSYEQMCGPVDPVTGYGTGWPQLGQNVNGQNLYVVDALAAIKTMVEKVPPARTPRVAAASTTAGDYSRLEYEQLAGPVGEDGYGHGWPQLGGLSVTDAVAGIKRVLEGGAPPIIPPPETGGVPADRHALLTCSGTWAPPGVGFPSDVAFGCQDVCEEIPVQAPWSFGPIPPGDFHAPSYKESVQIGVDWAVDWLLARPNRTWMLGGYSQGGECASRIWQETQPGGRLESVAGNFIGGYTFGNPSRLVEHTFYAGPPRRGEGIAEYRMPAPLGDWWADELDPGDMYAAVPTNLAGEIMRDIYTLCIEMELHSGPQAFAQTLAYNAMEVVENLDGDAYDDVAETAATMGADFTGAKRVNVTRISARLGGEDDVLSVKGIAAAVEAAIFALVFFCQGTRPHIEYHIREVFPGQTYVQHAIQHVHHWAGTRVPTQ